MTRGPGVRASLTSLASLASPAVPECPESLGCTIVQYCIVEGLTSVLTFYCESRYQNEIFMPFSFLGDYHKLSNVPYKGYTLKKGFFNVDEVN